ncbi:efflux RND transporter permease subunit [uncultured Alteromonas sp.]|uniref:efflux RND transporter permease subunit n=1 Tax=uncultured Alteromonas sp. TaxID=179113 RepID=UPI0030D0874D|tara:strand:+ start:179 stop:1156 length:978 start_codon:yes stop_codon:yes gene_type:complete
MDITRAAIKNASGVGIGIAILVFLGLYSLFNLPVQLFPDIERPNINIQTSWRAASPQEIESEIIEPQEEVLQGIPGLVSMNAWSNQGNAWINLEFSLGTDMQRTLIEVISRMNRVPPLPRDALSPNIMLAGSGGDAPALTYFFMQRLPGNPNEINTYVTYFSDVIKPQLESIPGVARARMESGVGGEEEFQIVFDPFKAAQLGIDLTAITTALGQAHGLNRNDAVEQAIQLRLRPIFMSTLTSIFGMLPLLLLPGAGSVIYRGLAAVIVGGMSISTVFTLVLLPTLLRMTRADFGFKEKAKVSLVGTPGGLPTKTVKLSKFSDLH